MTVGGILVGNRQWFFGYEMMPESLSEQLPLIDQATHFLVHFFVEGSFIRSFRFFSVSASRCKWLAPKKRRSSGFTLQKAFVLAFGHRFITGRHIEHLLAPVGRTALTNYLMQTAVSVTIFYGHGFGRFGTLRAGAATLIALAIFLVQVLTNAMWLKYFAYGSVEWIWRQLTYRQRLSFRSSRR